MKVMVIEGFSEFLKGLVREEPIGLVALNDPDESDEGGESGVAQHIIPYRTKSKVDGRAIRTIREAIVRFRPDVVHAFTSRPLANAVIATMGMSDAPPLVSFRGIMTPASRWDPSNRISYLHRRVRGHACASNAVRNGLIQSGVSPEKCVTTYDCVRVGALQKVDRSALDEWNIPRGAFVVGTVATIRPVKGIDLLLRAAIECADLGNVYWLLIGPVRDRLVEKLAGDPRIADRVRLVGLRRDAKALISAADLFVMPSRAEGLCLALLEAMAQRVCPVVSDAGGMKEVVRHRQDGLVVPREDVHALAEAIRELHGAPDRRQTMAESAWRRVAESFSAAQMGRRTLELYRRVLAA